VSEQSACSHDDDGEEDPQEGVHQLDTRNGTVMMATSRTNPTAWPMMGVPAGGDQHQNGGERTLNAEHDSERDVHGVPFWSS
jgi:hypothetical protein